jgi:hypothetical protein
MKSNPQSPAAEPGSASTTLNQPGRTLVESIRRRFAALGGIELELPCRNPMGPPPEFADDDSR